MSTKLVQDVVAGDVLTSHDGGAKVAEVIPVSVRDGKVAPHAYVFTFEGEHHHPIVMYPNEQLSIVETA